MSWIKDEIAHLTKLFTKWEGKVVTELKTLEADAAPLFKQIQSELTTDAYALAKQELTVAINAALSGGGVAAIGSAIAATVPAVLATLKLDGNTAAKNAIYGIASIVQAQLTGTSVTANASQTN